MVARRESVLPGDVLARRVYWQWIILLIAKVLLTGLLLCAFVALIRRRPLLFKSSSLALLFRPLDGCEDGPVHEGDVKIKVLIKEEEEEEEEETQKSSNMFVLSFRKRKSAEDF
ncbi:hypothetical protein AAE478_002474 [Parahypoxylon ruwenzoriense]